MGGDDLECSSSEERFLGEKYGFLDADVNDSLDI